MKGVIINNTARSRFEMELGGEFAFLEYRFYKGDIALMHTFVPEDKRNRGVAFQLAKYALEYVRNQNLKLMVYCPTVAKFIKLHPEYETLIDRKYLQLKHS